MPDSYPFPIYSGLLEPKHYKSIGSALWLFLWCVSSTTKDIEKDGVTWGIVLGNKPIKRDVLAEQFGVEEKTVRRWIKLLEEQGYIRVTRAPYGMIFTVRNSKKYQSRLDKNVHSPLERVDKNVHSDDSEWTKMSTLLDKNVHSNKDITGDITEKDFSRPFVNANANDIDSGDGMPITGPQDEISPLQEIENHYVAKRGKGFSLSASDVDIAEALLTDGIPLSAILGGIDEAFKHYKPRFPGDAIRSFSYCDPIIRESHYRQEAKKGGRTHAETDRGRAGPGRTSSPGGSSQSDLRGEPGSGYYDQYPGLIQSL